MTANLTINDLFTLILFLIGIGAGIVFILVLIKINKILGNIKDVLEENTKAIDATIKQLPDISCNLNEITKETKNTLVTLKPEVDALLFNVNNISKKVSGMTDNAENVTNKVSETFDKVSESLVDAAFTFQNSAKGINYYLNMIKDIVEIIKNTMLKK